MIYIHYYFADFAKKNGINIFNDAKTSSFFQQKIAQYKSQYRNIQAKMVSGARTTDEALSLIDAIEADALFSNERKEYFQSNYKEIKSAKSMRTAAAAGETVAEEVQLFVDQLKNLIQTATTSLGINLEELKTEIIKQYCVNKGISQSDSNFKQQILQDFLTHEGIKKLNINAGGTGQKALDSSLRNIILLAEALPEYGTGGSSSLGGMKYSTKNKSNGRTKNASETLDIIQAKLQGLLNNVVGVGAEIAWAEAEEVGERKLANEIVKVNASVVGGTVTTDGQLKEKQQEKDSFHVSKPDVQVNITANNVSITYGASVKQYKFNSKTNTGAVSLVSNTPLLAALEKYGKQNLYSIYNLAAGHADKERGYSAAELNHMWDNLVKQVTMANFLDALIGLGDLSVLYLVVNGQVIPVSQILERITEENIVGRLVGDKVVNRNAFVRMNRWVGDEREGEHRDNLSALWRSAEAEQSIYNRLSQTKIDISLKNLLNMI